MRAAQTMPNDMATLTPMAIGKIARWHRRAKEAFLKAVPVLPKVKEEPQSTKVIQDNGFNPIWNETSTFEVRLPRGQSDRTTQSVSNHAPRCSVTRSANPCTCRMPHRWVLYPRTRIFFEPNAEETWVAFPQIPEVATPQSGGEPYNKDRRDAAYANKGTQNIYSSVNFYLIRDEKDVPEILMTSAEVKFLWAEIFLRGIGVAADGEYRSRLRLLRPGRGDS